MQRGQFTRAEAHKLASLSVEQKPQSAGELPRAARLEIDLAIGIRHSRVEMRAELLGGVCAGGRMHAASQLIYNNAGHLSTVVCISLYPSSSGRFRQS